MRTLLNRILVAFITNVLYKLRCEIKFRQRHWWQIILHGNLSYHQSPCFTFTVTPGASSSDSEIRSLFEFEPYSASLYHFHSVAFVELRAPWNWNNDNTEIVLGQCRRNDQHLKILVVNEWNMLICNVTKKIKPNIA